MRRGGRGRGREGSLFFFFFIEICLSLYFSSLTSFSLFFFFCLYCQVRRA